MLGVVLCVPIDSFFSSSLIVLLNPVTILYHFVACVFLSLLAVWNDPQTILQDIRACVQKDYFVFFFFFFCFSELSFFCRNSSTFQFIFSHALTSSLLTCVFRVICMCNACGGKEKPMRPSEWERHTGCRKKKWKESIRVKNPDQPLVSWVSHLLLCLQLRMVL
jgi:hypothetical protein